jgi:preprotein translocase subunit SecB
MKKSSRKVVVRETAPGIPAVADAGLPVGEMRMTPIRLQAVALRKLSYEETTPVQGAARELNTSPERLSAEVKLEGTINLRMEQTSGTRIVELLLSASVRPDPSVRPVAIDVTLAALFSAGVAVSTRQLLQFVNDGGVRLLFPYLREIISAVSARGIYGPIFLDPVVIGPLRPDAELDRLLAQMPVDSGRG